MSVKLHYDGELLWTTNLHPFVEAACRQGLGLSHHLNSCHYSNTIAACHWPSLHNAPKDHRNIPLAVTMTGGSEVDREIAILVLTSS